MPVWRLEVLGGGALVREELRLQLERKTAALLCYLALEGPAPRSRLAGLLWPGSSEETARANLRQLLKRLREAAAGTPVGTGDPLCLQEIECDAAELQVAAFLGRVEQAAPASGALLAGFDYDDCPEFDDWLLSRRERLAGLRQGALLNLALRLEAQGDYREAQSWAEALLETDPVSEEAHRLLMRLAYLKGDRPAALHAYARCKEVLRRELGVEPLPETVELAREIERGLLAQGPAAGTRPAIPLSVLRPPLAGRAADWQRLEAAWDSGLPVLVAGETGVGKTRLVQEFAASKGRYALLESRPADANLPFSSLARHLRALLAANRRTVLEPWVRRELSRLLPELGDEAPPLASDAGKLRLFEAARVLVESVTAPLAALVSDDLHYMDPSSFAALLFLSLHPGGPRFIHAFQPGEAQPATASRLSELVQAGKAVLVELAPLTPEGVAELLEGLELSGRPELAARLERYTGGNPLFIVETLKSLIEADLLAHEPSTWAPPGRVRSLLSRRVAGLPQAAQRLLQVAAVAGEAFDLELAASVLATQPLALAGALQDLETAQMMRGLRFSHDLLLETVSSVIPAPVRSLLHRRVLDVLAGRGAPAALLALHAEAAGQQDAAFTHHLQAGDDAMRLFALPGAIRHYEAAHRLALQRDRSVPGLRRLYYSLGFAYVYTSEFERARALYQALLDHARTAPNPELEWLAHNHLAYLAVHEGRGVPEAAAASALASAERSGDEKLLVEALQELAGLHTLAQRPKTALAHAERALAVARQTGDPRLVGRGLLELEAAAWKLARLPLALASLAEARDVYRKLGDEALEARALHSLGFDLVATGRAQEGASAAQSALLLARRAGNAQEELNALGVAALGLRELGRYAEARERATEGLRLARNLGVPVMLVMSLRRLALVHLSRFEFALAGEALDEATSLDGALPRRPRSGELEALRCSLRLMQGALEDAVRHAQAATAAQDFPWAEPWIPRWPVVEALMGAGLTRDAEAVLRGYRAAGASPRHRLTALQARAAYLRAAGRPEQAASLLAEALDIATELALAGAQIELGGQLAALHGRLGRSAEAAHSRSRAASLARRLAESLDPAERRAFLAAATAARG